MPGEEDKTGAQSGSGEAADPKPAVTFKTEGEFLAAVGRKAKKAAEEEREKTKAEVFAALGIESEEDLPKLKETIAASAKTVTEAEKLKSQLDKVTKEHGKTTQRAETLQAKLKGIARRDALAPFATKVRDMDVFSMLADKHLEVDDDGVVTVKDGGKVEDWVESTLKAKDYLRVPAATQGAGTTATEPRKPNDGAAASAGAAAAATTAAAAATNGTPANGATTPRGWAAQAMAELKAKGQLPGPASGP